MNANFLNEKFVIAEEIGKNILENDAQKICFVCTGNTCRSPMAAAVFNDIGKNMNSYAISAGIFPKADEPISIYAVEALKSAGIYLSPENNYSAHTAKAISEKTIKLCDKIIGISERHTMMLLQSYPQYSSKIFTMPRDIPDPFEGDLENYKNCLSMIINGIKEFFNIY